jgi:hypothetical protein
LRGGETDHAIGKVHGETIDRFMNADLVVFTRPTTQEAGDGNIQMSARQKAQNI